MAEARTNNLKNFGVRACKPTQFEKKRKGSLLCVYRFGLFINKVIVVGVEYNPILDEVLNQITYFPISFESHIETNFGSTWSVAEISFATISVGVLFLWKILS